MQKPQCAVRWLFDYCLIFVNIFLCYFFSKAGFKRSLKTRKPFKNNLIKWKTKQSWKDMYGNISLYCQYFSPERGSNVHKTYFYFLKRQKSILFCLLRSKKLYNEKYIHVIKNDRNMELNTTILSKNERVCSLSKSQEYNLTLNCSKTSLWKKVTYCDLNEIFF